MELRNFINGKFINSISKKNIPVLNPSNQKVVGNIDEALEDEINLAFESAKKAFDKRILLDMDAKDKSMMMRAIANKLREKKDEGGKILSQENGKTIAQCIGEFEGAANTFDFYAGLTVPKIDDCADFPRFSFAVLDQDFHLIQELDGQNFQWWEWYEPYGKKWYWVGPEYGEDFKSTKIFDAGTYYIKVYNKDNKGNYVLAVGDIEKFTPLVIAKTIITLPRINRKFWNKRNCD